MNQHECMKNVTKAIFYMKENNIGSTNLILEYLVFKDVFRSGFPACQPGTAVQSLPKWIGTLVQRMTSDAPINVKLFIVKLIVNCSSVFECYGSQLLVPVTKVVVQYMKVERGNWNKIDQFVEDALVTMLCWKQEKFIQVNRISSKIEIF